VALLGWLLLLSPALGQPVTPAPLYVLVVDGQGRWQPERQERFEPPAELAGDQALSTDWKALAGTRLFRRLSYNDRLALLAYPERLLSSTWADEYFAARDVLVLRPMGQKRIEGRLFDLARGRESAVVVSEETSGQGGSPRGAALAQALQRSALEREPVLANPDGLYHRVGAAHLSSQVHYEPVESAERAEQYGFQPCRICYPQASRDPLYDDLDRQLGELVAAQIESAYPVLEEGEEVRRVQAVGQRLLRDNRFLDQGYQFKVLDTETPNAYAAPTGPIYVTTGMLALLNSDDELAAVLGHELSHSERKHGRKQYEQAQQTGMLGLVVTMVTGFPWASLGTDVLGTVLVRGYSRGYELEADRDGMMAAYAAGYDPAQYLRVQDELERISDERGGSGPGWLQTHPRGDERKGQLQEILDGTAALRGRLDKLQEWDPGLARYLKGRVLFLNQDQTALSDYLTRYETFAHASERPPLTNPRGIPIEVWQTVDSLLPGAELEATPAP
jgi:hypothetical protein